MTNEAQRSEASDSTDELGDAREYLIEVRADQVELALECFSHVQNMLDQGTVLSEAHKMAGRFVYRRLEELSESVTKQVAAQIKATPNVGNQRAEARRADDPLD